MKNERGQATLIAMLIMLGLLMAIAAMSAEPIIQVQQSKNESEALANMQEILATAGSYYSSQVQYPAATSSFLTDLAGCGNCSPILAQEFNRASPLTVGRYVYTVSLPPGATANQAFMVVATPLNAMAGRKSFCIGASQQGGVGLAVGGLVHQKAGDGTPVSLDDCISPGGTWEVAVTSTQAGPAGPPGPTNAVSIPTPGIQLVNSGVTQQIGSSMNLPAGKYVVVGTVGAGALTNIVVCWLVDSQGTLTQVNTKAWAGGQGIGATPLWGSMTMTAQLNVVSADTISISCQPNNNNVQLGPSTLSAIRATNLSM